jgi:hypothetical protein
MGVKGLAAWMREEPQRRLFQSDRRHISTSNHQRTAATDFVFDLHALALYIHRSAGLDRSKGGDYGELGIATRAVFRTIRQVGVRPVVVASGWQVEKNALSFDSEVVDLRVDAVDDKLTARILRREAHYAAMDVACDAQPTTPDMPGGRKGSGGNPSWNSNKTVLTLFAEQVIREVAEQEGVEVLDADGEAAALVAWIAASRGGYAVTNDCDMLCFSDSNSQNEVVANLRVIFVEDLRITTGGNAGVAWRWVQPLMVADALGLQLPQMPMLATLTGNDLTQWQTVGDRQLLSPLHEHAVWYSRCSPPCRRKCALAEHDASSRLTGDRASHVAYGVQYD